MNYEECRRQALCDLAEYKYLKSSISVLHKQLQLVQKIARNDNGATDVNTLLPYRIQAQQIKDTIQRNKVRIQCIELALSVLPKKDRDNLTAFYINRTRNSINEMARKEYTDRSTLYRRANRSVDKYIFAYFGVTPPVKK